MCPWDSPEPPGHDDLEKPAGTTHGCSAGGTDCQGHAQAYSYDCSGNLTGDGTWSYVYDPENHTMSANKTGTSASYNYDPLGRRQTKTVGVLVTNMLSDGDDLIAEYDGSGSGTALRRFVPGPAINDPIAYENCAGATAPNCTGTGVVTEFYHNDHHGSVVTMSAVNGDPDTAEGPNKYDPFGRATLATSNQPFRYVGMYYDAETGLYQDRARCYIPNLGRFCQTDPVGYAGGDLNLYTYTYNDPTDKMDPSGNCAEDACIGEAGVGISAGAVYVITGALVAGGVCVATCGYIHDKIGDAASNVWNHIVRNDSTDKPSSAGESPEIKPADLKGKTKDEIKKIAKDKCLVPDSKKPNKFRDPVTDKERIRIDPGHKDPNTGDPYKNPNAAKDHAHGYEPDGKAKIRDPETGDPHFPLKP